MNIRNQTPMLVSHTTTCVPIKPMSSLLLKFRRQKQFPKSEEVEDVSEHLPVPMDQKALTIRDPTDLLVVRQQLWVLQKQKRC